MGTDMVRAVCSSIEKMEPQFQAALPAHIPAKKFVRTTLSAIQQNPSVLDADRRTLFQACQQAAQDGLILDGREAALVVFGGKGGKRCQYMPMLAGILKKIRNSGEISTIAAECVYENDAFSYRIHNGVPQLNHEPKLIGPRGEVILAYAVAVLKDGGVMTEVMTVEDIEKVRAVSRAATSNYGPWVQWWDQMACKTVIRRLAKRLPQSTDIDVVHRDDDMYEFDQPQAKESKPENQAATRAESVILDDDDDEDGRVVDAEVVAEAEEVLEGDVL